MLEIEEQDNARTFQIHTYITGASKKHDPRHFFLRMAMDLYFRKHGHDILTNLRSFTHWGRAKWTKVLTQVRAKHPKTRIGVFFCGPAALGKEVEGLCAQLSSDANGAFVFRKEQFGL